MVKTMKNDPKIKNLAHELGLTARGNAFEKIRSFALQKASDLIEGFPCKCLDSIRELVAQRLSVHIETIEQDNDISTIAKGCSGYNPRLKAILEEEFVRGNTEAVLLQNKNHQPGDLLYLAVVDARGNKAYRAYFSIWHELSHLLVAPPQLEMDFRRSPTLVEIKKDPIESLVDSIAGFMAFYEPIFYPVLQRAIENEGEFNFAAIEAARNEAAPSASFLSTVLASLAMSKEKVTFISADWRYKKSEERRLSSKQLPLILDDPVDLPVRKLRVDMIVIAPDRNNPNLGIHKNMRIPEDSVIYRVANENLVGINNLGLENLSWWENSADGHLPARAIRVIATQCGPHTYALIFPIH